MLLEWRSFPAGADPDQLLLSVCSRSNRQKTYPNWNKTKINYRQSIEDEPFARDNRPTGELWSATTLVTYQFPDPCLHRIVRKYLLGSDLCASSPDDTCLWKSRFSSSRNADLYFCYQQWERLLDPLVWLDAATQIFFSLGLACGTMIAYASYNSIHENTLRDAITISFANCMTSLFAGVVVFSILGFR